MPAAVGVLGSEAQRYRTGALGGRCVAVGRFGSGAGAGFVEVAVEGGAGDAQQVGDLLHGVLAGVVELLCVPCLRWAEGGAPAAGAAPGSGGGQAVAGVGDDELALEFARTESMPNMARPSAVVVSMPCSSTCSWTLRSRRAAPRVTRCSTERPSRSRRVTTRVSPARRWRRSRSNRGRLALAPLARSR